MSFQTAGDVWGDVDGDVMGDEVVGFETVGGRRRRRRQGNQIMLPNKPGWRRQIAPGVPMPGEGLQPLPLRPSANGGVFTQGFTAIEFTARPQVPFQPERLLASVRRAGTNAPGVLIEATNLFVGRDLQLVELGSFDIEFFAANAFGVRLKLDAAQPGVLISMSLQATPSSILTSTDTLAVSLMFLGSSLR